MPIRGEAGFVYVLEGGYDLPPLMLTTEKLWSAYARVLVTSNGFLYVE